jgi:hypothetical protein
MHYSYFTKGIIMNKELILAAILLSVSTVLKVFSVIALCHISFTIQPAEHTLELEHPHKEHQLLLKKKYHYTHQLR